MKQQMKKKKKKKSINRLKGKMIRKIPRETIEQIQLIRG
jgi:hypothetical protein